MDEGQKEFLRDRYVMIMAEYAPRAIWDKDGAATPLEWLPVTAALDKDVANWIEEFDIQRPWDPECHFDYEDHNKRGRELARRVKAQLPGWTVMFYDEDIGKRVAVTSAGFGSRLTAVRDAVAGWVRRVV